MEAKMRMSSKEKSAYQSAYSNAHHRVRRGGLSKEWARAVGRLAGRDAVRSIRLYGHFARAGEP